MLTRKILARTVRRASKLRCSLEDDSDILCLRKDHANTVAAVVVKGYVMLLPPRGFTFPFQPLLHKHDTNGKRTDGENRSPVSPSRYCTLQFHKLPKHHIPSSRPTRKIASTIKSARPAYTAAHLSKRKRSCISKSTSAIVRVKA